MRYVFGVLADPPHTPYCEEVRIWTSSCAVIVATIICVAPLSAYAASNAGVEDAVREYFADALVMVAIAKCESNFQMFSEDKALDGGSGGMIGIFQINSSVHARYAKQLGMDIYTLNGNLAYARYLYEREGTQPWDSSSGCWEKDSLVTKTQNKRVDFSSTTISANSESQQIALLRTLIATLTQLLLEMKRPRELASR